MCVCVCARRCGGWSASFQRREELQANEEVVQIKEGETFRSWRSLEKHPVRMRERIAKLAGRGG